MALRDLAEDRVELTLAAAGPDFFYKPMVVSEPFSAGHADRRALEPIARHFGARFVEQAVSRVAPDSHTIALADGEELSYDALVVCVGAQSRPAYPQALTFDANDDPLALSRSRGRVLQAGHVHRAAWRDVGAADLRAGVDDRAPRLGHGL